MNISEANAPAAPQQTSRWLVTDLLSGGGATLLVGLCLLVVAKVLVVMAIPGFICIAAGIALLIAGCLVFPFSKRPVSAR